MFSLNSNSLFLFRIASSSRVTTIASLYSVMELSYEPWHERCVSNELKRYHQI